MQSYLQDFLLYLQESPTVYHAAKETAHRLAEKDFTPLEDDEEWELEPEKGYFLVKDESLVIAFKIPKDKPKRILLLASHLDSPAFKIRPDLSSPSDISQLGIEIYGGPLLNSWFNIDLGIAGRIFFIDSSEKLKSRLINFTDFPLIIPQLPIHLDREVNDKGLQINKQEHLRPIFSFSKQDFAQILQKEFQLPNLFSYDLFLYPLQPARFIGFEHEMIASYRLDNLSSAHAALWAIITSEPSEDALSMSVFWDHEEIGSMTNLGAGSTFLHEVLEKIAIACKMTRNDLLLSKPHSLGLSIDVAHGFHPNYPLKFDPQFTPSLSKGISLKYSAAQKYMNNAFCSAFLQKICKQIEVPLQKYVARNDNPSGSTVGHLMASSENMRIFDIGVPLLAMHSTREIVSSQDQFDMVRILKKVLESDPNDV